MVGDRAGTNDPSRLEGASAADAATDVQSADATAGAKRVASLSTVPAVGVGIIDLDDLFGPPPAKPAAAVTETSYSTASRSSPKGRQAVMRISFNFPDDDMPVV
jgi:hypothetical protein